MSDDLDRYLRDLNEAFMIAKGQAEAAAQAHNCMLQLTCPECDEDSYVPGLRCVTCGHEEPIDRAWRIVRGDEFGWVLIPLSSQRTILGTFHVDM